MAHSVSPSFEVVEWVCDGISKSFVGGVPTKPKWGLFNDHFS